MAAAKKTPAKKGTRKRRGVRIEPVTLEAAAVAQPELSAEQAALVAQVVSDGGALIGSYREPLGGHVLLLVSLPIERVAPTPFQRDVSDAHVRKLTRAMDKTKRFLDPIIVVRMNDQYLTPNGNHRLTVMKELGARAIIGLLVPEAAVAYQILALNIEKAHNLRERALEVLRMYRDLAESAQKEAPPRSAGAELLKETDFELEFEEPSLATLGFAYEQRGRFSGGAYHPAVRKVDGWVDASLSIAVKERERRAALLLELDDAVSETVKKLKDQGLTSPYLRSFVVARINPLRFIKGDPPSFDELMATMTKRARGMKTDRIQSSDLAKSGGAPDED